MTLLTMIASCHARASRPTRRGGVSSSSFLVLLIIAIATVLLLAESLNAVEDEPVSGYIGRFDEKQRPNRRNIRRRRNPV